MTALMPLSGLDVSRHQGNINWFSVTNHTGHRFAFCKATDGDSYSYTSYYRIQVVGMRAAGLIPGAYHWLTARDDPRVQARYFVSVIGNPTGLLCALDVERSPNGEEPTAAQARAFAAEFKRLTNNHPLILYTGRWYWVGALGNPWGADIGPLWHSEYDVGAEIADGPEQDRYGGWEKCLFWQYTSSGSCPGISGSVDLNFFYGDITQLQALTGAGPQDAVPQEDEDMPWIMSSEWTGQVIVDGGETTWIDQPAEVENLVNVQKLKVVSFVTESNARRFLAERGANVDEIIMMHTVALQEIESREEARDTAPEPEPEPLDAPPEDAPPEDG